MTLYASSLTQLQACSGGTAATLWSLKANNVPLRVVEWGISLDEIDSAATPGIVDLVRQTSPFTAGRIPSAITYQSFPAAVSNASIRFNGQASYFTEPNVYVSAYEKHSLTPTGGLLIKQYPLGREPQILSGERIALRYTAVANSDASATGYVVWEE